MGCIRKMGNGRWRLDLRDPAGARRRATFDTRRDAEAALAELRQDINHGSYVSPRSAPTFRQVVDEWFAGKRDRRPSTLAAWAAHLDLHLLPDLGSLRLDQITVSTIEHVRDRLRASGLSPQTVNKVLTTAAAVFKLALRRNYCRFSPAA